MSEPEEQRKTRRIGLVWPTKIRTAEMTDSVRMKLQEIHNISLGGVFVATSNPLPVGTVVVFEFNIPDEEKPVHPRGVVRWTSDGEIGGQEAGMGIEFVEMSPALKAWIESMEAGAS